MVEIAAEVREALASWGTELLLREHELGYPLLGRLGEPSLIRALEEAPDFRRLAHRLTRRPRFLSPMTDPKVDQFIDARHRFFNEDNAAGRYGPNGPDDTTIWKAKELKKLLLPMAEARLGRRDRIHREGDIEWSRIVGDSLVKTNIWFKGSLEYEQSVVKGGRCLIRDGNLLRFLGLGSARWSLWKRSEDHVRNAMEALLDYVHLFLDEKPWIPRPGRECDPSV
jgi:hypothetical protein